MCTVDVNVLGEQNVMNGGDTPFFIRNKSVFQSCLNAGTEFFPQFCLYPPNEGHMPTMCSLPPYEDDPGTYFAQLQNKRFTTVIQFPRVISYPAFLNEDLDWVDTSLPTDSGTLDELAPSLGYAPYWFLGTTIVPVPPTVSGQYVLSRHSILRLFRNINTLVVQAANVRHLMLADDSRVTRLYSNGEIKIYANNNTDDIPLWQSFTDDQEGSNIDFNTLTLPLDSIAINTQGGIASPNGRYLLLVYADRVDLVFNPFNAPRFTQWTNLEEQDPLSLKRSVDAQSAFCFSGLNNIELNPILFLDGRCACLASQTLTERVYGPNRLIVLPIDTQLRLQEDVPCIMTQCDLDPAEYSNASFSVGTRCVLNTGTCAQYINTNMQNLVVAQDCGNGVRPCSSSLECPFGGICRNGQCVTQCTTDALCRGANPMSSCVDGQCVVRTMQQNSEGMWWWIGAVAVGVVLLILLILVVYYGVKRAKSKYKSEEEEEEIEELEI